GEILDHGDGARGDRDPGSAGDRDVNIDRRVDGQRARVRSARLRRGSRRIEQRAAEGWRRRVEIDRTRIDPAVSRSECTATATKDVAEYLIPGVADLVELRVHRRIDACVLRNG